MTHILITGGAGFIGSHLAEYLLQQGHSVSIVDDLTTGSEENIQHLYSFGNRFHFKHASILEEETLAHYICNSDAVFHLAAAVGVKYVLENPFSSFVVNLRGTELVLQLCAKFNKKVLITSSSEVYGKQTHSPLRETDDCIYGPSSKFRWSYAGTKLMDEFYALAYHRTVQLQVAIVRLFNVIGPRQSARYGMVVPRFISQALTDKPLTVFGTGQQTRTFTYISEVVQILAALIECPKAYGEVVNIGGTEEISMSDLAHRIVEKTDSTSPITFLPYSEAYPRDFEDMLRRVPCTDKLQTILGYTPTMSLDDALDAIIAAERQPFFPGEAAQVVNF